MAYCLAERQKDYFKQTTALDAYSLNLSLRLVQPALVEEAHRRGLKVFVYTVNEVEDIERMRAMGVDGIFCNYPDRVS